MDDNCAGAEKGGLLKRLSRTAAIAAIAAASLLSLPAAASADPSEIYMSDDCSPSFNVALNDPTVCNRQGGTPFGVFVQQLTQNKFAGAWHFSAPHVNVSSGSSLTFENRGGETHTITQVTQFGGGGIVEGLNQILFGTPNPPTFFFGPFNFVPAGGETTLTPATLTPGTHLFICAIHPWMHETIVVH
jgi:plastocyanin